MQSQSDQPSLAVSSTCSVVTSASASVPSYASVVSSETVVASASASASAPSYASVVSSETRLFDRYSQAVQHVTALSRTRVPDRSSARFNIKDLEHLFQFDEVTSPSVETSSNRCGSTRIQLQPPSLSSIDIDSDKSDAPTKRSKRKNGSDIPSSRSVERSRKRIERYVNKIDTKLVWSENHKGKCCSSGCNETVKLTSSDLFHHRQYLHSLPNDSARRNHFNRIIMASYTSTSQTIDLIQSQHIVLRPCGGGVEQGTEALNRCKGVILNVNGSAFEVCIKYFVWVHNVSLHYYYSCLKAGQGQRKLRGGSDDTEKCRLIRQWLTDFAKWHEYMPNENTIQLPYPRKNNVYNYYVEDRRREAILSATPEECRKSIASSSYFYKIWSKYERQIILRRHLRFSICDDCAALRRHRDKHITQTQLTLNQKLFQEHIQLIQEERAAYHNKRDLARMEPNKYISVIMDGSTQYGYNMPHFKYTTKTNSSIEKMKLHVTGVLVHGWRAFMYTSNDRWIGGSSLSVEILQRTLSHLERDRALPPVFYLQLDNTGKDNKNNYFFVYLAWLVFRHIFQRIEVSFLPVGHTHEDIDQMFSRTSVRLKDIDIPTRQEFERHSWRVVIRA